MNSVRNGMKKTSIALITIGIISGIIESVFYGDVSTDGVLQESLFLPAAVFSIISGVILLVVWALTAIIKKLRK